MEIPVSGQWKGTYEDLQRRLVSAEKRVAELEAALRIAKIDLTWPGEPGRSAPEAIARIDAAMAGDGGGAPADCEHDYVFQPNSEYRCDKCGHPSTDGVHPRAGDGGGA